jgi:hypothetical protein
MCSRDLEEESYHIHMPPLPLWRAVETQELLLEIDNPCLFFHFRHETFSSGALIFLGYTHLSEEVS